MAKKVSLEEWKNRVETKTEGHFELMDIKYEAKYNNHKSKEAFLYIRHVDCGYEFKRRGGQWLKTQSCPKCLNLMKVSYLHAIICILFEKYYNGVELEKDIGFRGSKGGKSKYDLYVPNYNNQNLLIEFQSRFHDGKEEFDENKKKYAESNGYLFYSIDHRENKTLDIVQEFFPFIEEIPNWVYDEFYKFQKPNLSNLQELLDMELPCSKISELTGLSETIILNAIKNKIVTRTETHINKVYNIKPVIQLDLDGNFIKEYNSINQVKRELNINPYYTLIGTTYHSGGYVWVYKEKYLNNDYQIPDKNKLRYI